MGDFCIYWVGFLEFIFLSLFVLSFLCYSFKWFKDLEIFKYGIELGKILRKRGNVKIIEGMSLDKLSMDDLRRY